MMIHQKCILVLCILCYFRYFYGVPDVNIRLPENAYMLSRDTAHLYVKAGSITIISLLSIPWKLSNDYKLYPARKC